LIWLAGCQLPQVVKENVPQGPVHSVGAHLVDGGMYVRTKQDPNTPGFLKFNHKLHAVDQGIECIACHEISSTGKPGLPDHDVCVTCHEIKVDEPSDECALCHVLSPQQTQAGAWTDISVTQPKKVDTFQFDHKAFANDPTVCVSCHKAATTSEFVTDSVAGDHTTLFPEVRKHGITTEHCATCHSTINQQNPPGWHRRPDFRETHGKECQRINEGICFNCHGKNDCQTCHEQTKPQSHQRPEWLHSHGKVGTFDQKACTMCHSDQTCKACHNIEMPRDHTNFFRTRSHGKIASWNRERCLVCHKQDYCESCHIGAAPGIPAAGFHFAGTPCLICHSPSSPTHPLRRHGPLPEESCLKCHRFQ
jgi:hypothetical protein